MHKRVCERLNGLKNKTFAQEALEEAGEITIWGELLSRRLFCGSAQHLYYSTDDLLTQLEEVRRTPAGERYAGTGSGIAQM